jgi:hypothetical protein
MVLRQTVKEHGFGNQLKIFFHCNGNAVLEQIFALGHEFRGQGPKALVRELTIGGAPEIHFRIGETVAAMAAFPGSVVLEKLNGLSAFRAFCLEYGTGFPVSAVLSGTFHGLSSS